MFLEEIQKHDEYVIYGAQVVAYGAYRAITKLTGKKPLCFVVGKSKYMDERLQRKPQFIEDIPVKIIEEISKDIFIVVGVTELIQKEVLPFLYENGYKSVFPLTHHEEYLLMSQYYDLLGVFPTVSECGTMCVKKKLELFEVRNDRDRPLEYHHELFSYEIPIQAGAALSDKRICEQCDDIGVNISQKNRMYCEMTAVYWIWKNRHYDWVGIEHYRRHLLVKPEMLSEDVDAIMPLPYICYPDEAHQFLRFVPDKILDALLKALKVLHPDNYKNYCDIIYGKYQYTYNLMCVKWTVFDDYCRWFFEITEYMEKMADEIPEIVNTRALSYVAEVLTNIYFMSHKGSLNILHVEKAIYI